MVAQNAKLFFNSRLCFYILLQEEHSWEGPSMEPWFLNLQVRKFHRSMKPLRCMLSVGEKEWRFIYCKVPSTFLGLSEIY